MLSHLRFVLAAPLLVVALACTHDADQPPKADAQPASTEAGPRPAKAIPAPSASAEPEEVDTLATRFLRGPLPADAPFEGEISFRVSMLTGPEKPAARYSFVMKGSKVRWDLVGDGGKGDSAGYRIYDAKQRKFYTVMHVPFVYVTPATALLGDAGPAHKYTLRPFALEPKGAVMGIPCNRMQTDDDRFHYDVCVASGMPGIPLNALAHGLDLAVPFGEVLEANGQFPLDVVVREPKAGAAADSGPHRGPAKWHATLKVSKITRAQVSDAAFDLPGYKIVESPNLSPAVPAR